MYIATHWLMRKSINVKTYLHLVTAHVKYKRSVNHICCHYFFYHQIIRNSNFPSTRETYGEFHIEQHFHGGL